MAAEALLGVAAQQLCTAIISVKSNAKTFELTLSSLKETVNSVTPKIIEIDRLNRKLDDFPKGEISALLQQLEKAAELVSTCSEVSRWNWYRKYKYNKRLNEKDLSLKKLLGVEVQAAQAVNIQRVLLEVIEMNKKLGKMNLKEDYECKEGDGEPRKPKFEMNYGRKTENYELHFRISLGSRTH